MSRPRRAAPPTASAVPVAAVVGKAITLVIDRLTPDAARRIVALFDRERGAPLAGGQSIDLHLALDILPHGGSYGSLISMWDFLPVERQAAWMREGRRHIYESTLPASERPKSAAMPPARRGGRGRAVLRGAFGKGPR